ncbi:PD-(D/E)XK motif protein [Streptomyces sp. NRRL F-5122]|uniref:PD-(D/E)XK motif protein n=1 Tax=Streptomyces sp. NRRL F-5122 TaxID=1609098 RepID=UPI0007C73A07|nr:PD-(D/E)XK motif protein [Streptomyces sp. NRRL F-5122]
MTERHTRPDPEVAWGDIEYYLDRGLATTVRLNGLARPRVDYVVAAQDIALHVELGAHQRPPRSALPMIRIDQVAVEGLRMARIRSVDPSLARDFHDLLCAVAHRIVEHHHSLEEAFAETVRAWSALLNRRRVLDTEKRIGLIGELAVLHAIGALPGIGWADAVTAWVGGSAEEHDFALPAYDIEVKTTALEQRRHVIHGAGQLTPKPHRPLWLVSLQVTRGGASGRSLADCVTAVRDQVRTHAPQQLVVLDDHLAGYGWDPAATDEERWSLRSAPLVLPVDARLPRIDDPLLDGMSPTLRARIDNLSYRIDLTGLPPAPQPPAPLIVLRLP